MNVMRNYEVDYNGERRESQAPVPENLKYILNSAQLVILNELMKLDWQLLFVRRSVYQPVVAVISAPNGATAVLEDDGIPNVNHGMQFRH